MNLLNIAAPALLSIAATAACAAGADPPAKSARAAHTLYVGGDILTMQGPTPSYVQALAVRDGRIVHAGSRAGANALVDASTVVVDLKGRTLLPGFIDAHGHLPDYVSTWGLPELSPPPVGDVRSIADLLRKFRDHLAAHPPAPGEAVIGSGYDDSLLAERRHPTRAELDGVSRDVPLLARHASGHLLVANSAALARAGITKDTRDPEGGVMRRTADGELDGVMEEQALAPFLTMMPKPAPDEWTRRLVEIQKMYLGYGITTAGDHLGLPDGLGGLRRANAEGRLLLDVVSYPIYMLFDDVLDGRREIPGVGPLAPGSRTYEGRHKIQGIKIAIDGSPQGKTAFLSAPYRVPPPGQPADYRAYPTMTQERLDRWIDAAWRHRVQVAVHANGDAAAQMVLEAVRKARAKHGARDLRPILVHAQTARRQQITEMKKLGILPSFFTAHTFYWGDWHVDETLGPERAARISALHHAAGLGMRYTNHTDSPVVPPDMMHLVWTAVTRESRTGRVLGPSERATPYEALKAITDHAAWQYFEEASKGTLEPGKRADLVVLDRNPLKVKPAEIRGIAVLETIKDGRSVWSRER
jgi:predicted amidohydrolase YtcJ